MERYMKMANAFLKYFEHLPVQKNFQNSKSLLTSL